MIGYPVTLLIAIVLCVVFACQVPRERILLSVILCAVGVPVYFITKVVNKKQAEAGPKAE